MPDFLNDLVRDNGLTYLRDNTNAIVQLTAEPIDGNGDPDFTEANTLVSGGGAKIGEIPTTPSALPLGDDGSGGREVDLATPGWVADEGGTQSYSAHVDTDNNVILAYTELNATQSVTATEAYNTTLTIGIQ